jgi:hypothetical protein
LRPSSPRSPRHESDSRRLLDRGGVDARRRCSCGGSWIQGWAGAAQHGRGGGCPAQRPYDLELLIRYGTSKGGSAGHLALALRGELPDDDLVYSANFYANRTPEHERGFYTANLMMATAKKE